jgi:hypothetical protein
VTETTSFLFNVLKTQWLALAIGGGTILLFLAILTYLAIWRPREKLTADRTKAESGWRHALRHTPLILILTYVVSILYAVVFTIYVTKNTPNW